MICFFSEKLDANIDYDLFICWFFEEEEIRRIETDKPLPQNCGKNCA